MTAEQKKERAKVYNKRFYDAHSEEIKAHKRDYHKAHPEKARARASKYAKENREKVNAKVRRAHWRTKLRVIEMLGGRCHNCGNEDIRVLQINHINGGGKEDHDKGNLYQDIVSGKRSTEDLELLCANCNIIYEYERGKRRVI